MVGKIHFGLLVDGQRLGSINAENWRAWNFNIQDAQGAEVARITKTWEGLAKTMFTTADNYVVQISPALARSAAQPRGRVGAVDRHGTQARQRGFG
jgi:hypothetical protein